MASIQEDLLDNSLTSTQVKIIGGGGFNLKLKGGTINLKFKVCSLIKKVACSVKI